MEAAARQASAPAPISCAELARRLGVSKPAVTRAIKSGRLRASVVRDASGAPKISDPLLAEQEWKASTDLSRAPGYVKERAEASTSPGGSLPPTRGEELSLSQESAREKHWKANLAELECKRLEGELVESALVEARLAGVFAQCKTKLLAISSRARQALPHLSATDVVVLDDLVREALQDLVDEETEAAQ